MPRTRNLTLLMAGIAALGVGLDHTLGSHQILQSVPRRGRRGHLFAEYGL